MLTINASFLIVNNQLNRVYIGDLPLTTIDVFIEDTLLGYYKGIYPQ